MTHREAQSIEQCISCGQDVAIYSRRQLVDGEPMCGCCRRVYRASKKEERRAVVVVEATRPRPVCPHTNTGISPIGVRYCHACLSRVD